MTNIQGEEANKPRGEQARGESARGQTSLRANKTGGESAKHRGRTS